VAILSKPERRRSKRTTLRKTASLLVKGESHAHRVPCVILDNSKDGFKIGGVSRLKRGQLVELIPDEDTPNTMLCRVMWVGKPGSKQGGEAGLRIR
jgi:hypothetical protein